MSHCSRERPPTRWPCSSRARLPDADRLARRVAKYRQTDEQHAPGSARRVRDRARDRRPGHGHGRRSSPTWRCSCPCAPCSRPIRAPSPISSCGRRRRSAHATASIFPFTFGNFVDGWDEFVGADDDAYALSSGHPRRVGRVRAYRESGVAGVSGGDGVRPRVRASRPFTPHLRAPSRYSGNAVRAGRPSTRWHRVGDGFERAARDRLVQMHGRIGEPRIEPALRPRPRATASSGGSSRRTPSRAATSSPSSASGPVMCSGPSRTCRAGQGFRGHVGDVVGFDPRDLPRAGRQHEAAALEQVALPLDHRREERRLHDHRRNRRRGEAAFDRAVIAVQSRLQTRDRDVRDLDDALDAGALRRVDRVRLELHLVATSATTRGTSPRLRATHAASESASPRSPSAASVASSSSNAPSRRTNARVSTPRVRNAATTAPPRSPAAPITSTFTGRSLADTVAGCANRTGPGIRSRAHGSARSSRARCASSPAKAGSENLSGHITWATDDGGMWCNPWGIWWDEVRASDIVRLDADGEIVEGRWDVTPAVFLHTELHRARPDAAVIVHNHPYYATLLAHDGRDRRGIVHQNSCIFDGELAFVDEYAGVDDADDGEWLARAGRRRERDPARAPRRDRDRRDDRRRVLQGGDVRAHVPVHLRHAGRRPRARRAPARRMRAALKTGCCRTRRTRTGTARCASSCATNPRS